MYLIFFFTFDASCQSALVAKDAYTYTYEHNTALFDRTTEMQTDVGVMNS